MTILQYVLIFFLFLAAGFSLSAKEDAYKDFLRRDPEYKAKEAVLQTLRKKLEETGKAISPDYFVPTPENARDPKNQKKIMALRTQLVRSAAYNRIELECGFADMECAPIENRLCAAASDPAELAILKKHFLKQNFRPTNLASAPKKDTPGSPEFQHAMYVVDQVAKEGALKQKWPSIHAAVMLLANVRDAAFDDESWRKAHYALRQAIHEYAQSEMRINRTNFDLYNRMQIAWADMEDAKTPEAKKKYDALFAEMQEKKKVDPAFKKSSDAFSLAAEAERKLLMDFAERSDAPAAVEYRRYQSALKEASGK